MSRLMIIIYYPSLKKVLYTNKNFSQKLFLDNIITIATQLNFPFHRLATESGLTSHKNLFMIY